MDAVQEAVHFGIGADRARCGAGDADLCMACICYCPREAIEYGKGVPVYEKKQRIRDERRCQCNRPIKAPLHHWPST